MYFLITIKVALKSLFANKLRSFLAVLGIIIGVGAVIAMLAIGNGAQKQIVDRLQAMGTDLLMVRPGARGSGGVNTGTRINLKVEDCEAILAEVQGIRALAPVVQGRAQAKYFENNTSTTVLGTSDSYLSIRNFKIGKGRGFASGESEQLARVAIIGATTAENLLGQDEPIGATIKLDGINFKIIGVLEAKGDQGWFNPDDQVIVPYATAMQQLLGRDYLSEIDIQGKPGEDLTKVQNSLTDLLRRRHRLQEDQENDFSISNQAEMMATMSAVTQTLKMLLGSVASISLIVGGIGIMNIMLVTVTERTREIGIRKAIGARDRDILQQFLIEAIVMSCVGGLIGVASGLGVAALVGTFTTFVTEVQPSSVFMAMGFASAIGVFFGYYPARRAAFLHPIEALRYE
jgi:putative ABC transport system permease protein